MNGRSDISSRHIAGGKVVAGEKVLVLPLLRENSPDAQKVRFSIHFFHSFSIFHARVKKNNERLQEHIILSPE